MSHSAETVTQNEALDEQRVRDYLLRHPSFFVSNQDIVEQLRVPHLQRGSVSLVEMQRDQLRQRVDDLNAQLSQLIELARQNQQLQDVFNKLHLCLVDCKSLAWLRDTLLIVLTQEMQMSAVSLLLFDNQSDISEIEQRQLQDKCFRDSGFFFGRIGQSLKHTLFNEQKVESVALVALGNKTSIGVLAIGHADEQHFSPDMDTLFLRQLKAMIEAVLHELE